MRTETAGEAAPGLEGMPRTDIGAVEAAVPSLVERALTGPLVLTRNGREAFVLLPLDAWRKHWVSVRRAPLIDGVVREPAAVPETDPPADAG